MLTDKLEVINGEYDPMFDFDKHYNPNAEDIEKAELLMLEYQKKNAKNKINQ